MKFLSKRETLNFKCNLGCSKCFDWTDLKVWSNAAFSAGLLIQGVPQVKVWGPLPFSLYVSSLLQSQKRDEEPNQLVQYGGDSFVFTISKWLEDAIMTLQTVITNVSHILTEGKNAYWKLLIHNYFMLSKTSISEVIRV